MIKLNIVKPSKGQPVKTIYFIDEMEYCFRISHFIREKIVLDQVQEFNGSKQKTSETLYNEYYEVIAYQEYLMDANGKFYGTRDYEVINGQFKKLNTVLVEVVSKENKHTKHKWLNGSDECVYITEVSDQQEFRYVKPNGEVIDYDSLPEFLSVNKPLEFCEIRNQYLNQIVKENS
ncbi:hypothetical protein [Acinetobacter guillouiae]|uniref:hypothetical protein n=1 Tax=Acinetobacter guillouiae TaxID=106649 RepID=UPI0002CEEB9A|nr:hypothetical protein [Acinetobacter guillouiae]ENU60485.1 hypothetical protein F981_00398 [Acinetobacter guillouiae CIP 63.46]KAB0629921.1 hypothetical protein F7P82_01060 [Acinetobacter guillouiae]